MDLPPPTKFPPFPIRTNDQRAVLGVAVTFAVLPTTAVILRIIARRMASRKLDSSDYCIVAACVFAVTLQLTNIVAVFQAGIGYGHMMDIMLEYGMAPITKLLKIIIPFQFLWALSLSFCKISILLLYSKVFAVRLVIWTARGAIGFIAAWAIATIVAGCLICRPFAFNWDQTIPGGKCGNQVLSFTITGVFNLVTDVLTLVLPLPYLYKLQMQFYKKMVLIGVFSIGLCTCVISAVRIHTLSSMDFADITYSIPQANIFSGLECSVAVTLACIPVLRPLLGRSKYSNTGTVAAYPSNKRSAGGSQGDNRDFEPLDDDNSQYRLRPVGGGKSSAVVVTGKPASSGGRGSSDFEGDDNKITVKSQWHVSSNA